MITVLLLFVSNIFMMLTLSLSRQNARFIRGACPTQRVSGLDDKTPGAPPMQHHGARAWNFMVLCGRRSQPPLSGEGERLFWLCPRRESAADVPGSATALKSP